ARQRKHPQLRQHAVRLVRRRERPAQDGPLPAHGRRVAPRSARPPRKPDGRPHDDVRRHTLLPRAPRGAHVTCKAPAAAALGLSPLVACGRLADITPTPDLQVDAGYGQAVADGSSPLNDAAPSYDASSNDADDAPDTRCPRVTGPGTMHSGTLGPGGSETW